MTRNERVPEANNFEPQIPEKIASTLGVEAIFAVEPDMNMYHPESMLGGDRRGSAVSGNYNRSLVDYEHLLSTENTPFRIKDWKHKTILDIGSGAYDTFGHEARAKGVKVVSLNPALKDPYQRFLLENGVDIANQKRRERQGILSLITKKASSESVAALGQSLPFKDESFDGIVSVFGVPNYLHHVDEEYTVETKEKDKLLIAKAFNEILRVLKPGGKAFLRDRHLAPNDKSDFNKKNAFSESDGTEVLEILEELKELGITSEVYEDEFGVVNRLITITKPSH